MADFTNRSRQALLIATAVGTLAIPALAQDKNASDGSADAANQSAASDVLAQRIHRQHWRINHALKSGLIKDDQAKTLRDAVDKISADVQSARTKSGGTLGPEQMKQFESSLNQTSEQIRIVAEAGDASVQSAKGSQNSKGLLQQMKSENKRELKQEHQINERKIEQQQLQYEKEMVERLGEQKQDIIKGKEDLKDVRKESGAD